MDTQWILPAVIVGAIFLAEILPPLLVKTRLLKLPTELSSYKLFFRTVRQFSIRFLIAAVVLVIIFVRPQFLAFIPAQFGLFVFYGILSSVIITVLVYRTVPVLGTLCPQCGKKLKKHDNEPDTIESILIRKPCPQCGLKFAKPVDSERMAEEGERSFFDYLALSFGNNSKCSICGQPGRDNFEDGRGKEKRLCRDHVVSELEKEFLAFDKKMVVVYPGLEDRKKAFYVYQYYTTAEIKKFNMKEIVGDLTESGLAAIGGECKKCSGKASVAYFGKGTFRWEDDYPKLEEIDHAPEILCRKCTFKQIRESLRSFQGYFNEPVTSPHKDEGIQLPWTL